MKLGVITDVQVMQHQGQLVSPEIEMLQVACFCPYFDEVQIFTPTSAPIDVHSKDMHACSAENIRVVPVPGFWPHKIYGFAMGWPRVWRGLRRVLPGVDLVSVRLPRLCGLLAPALCRRLGIPYFVSIHGDWKAQFEIAGGRGGWRRLLPRLAWLPEWATNSVCRDAVVFSTSPDILERVKPVARSVHLTYSSLLDESDLADKPKELDPTRRLRLLYVGAVELHKGMQCAFEAMRLLSERGVDFEFHVVGRGNWVEGGRAFARQHGLADRMVFHGFVPYGPALLEHFRAADIFVFPSFSEGSPKVILEAMFKGLVVVSTGVGAIPTVVTDGVQGHLVPVRDAAAIADAVTRVGNDPCRFREMSAACLTRAAELTTSRVTLTWIDDLRAAGLYPVPAAGGG